MSALDQLLSQPGTILLDGAMGTELHRRGVDISLPLWSARALETDPEVVRAIHRDYLAAGAQLLTANTFRTTTFTYRRAGLDERNARESARRATRRAIELAREAVQAYPSGSKLVAGSLAPVGDCYNPGDYPGAETADITYRELARWLAEYGADVLLLETHITLAEALIAVQAAVKTGLPVLISFLIDEDLKLWSGDAPLSEAVRAAEGEGAQGILVNCVTLPVARQGVETIADLTTLPYGAYANAGRSRPSAEGSITELVPDEEFAAAAQEWIDLGARMIGGCCGTTPRTIALVHQKLSPLAPANKPV
ncbi:MAG: homocysteine S-methyltransferase family protein [Candidatus Neomarinimicrobiota bacterium]